jgi:hypothetical protein
VYQIKKYQNPSSSGEGSGGQFSVMAILIANVEMDDEWVELIMNARNIGITPEEIRNFLKQMTEDPLIFAKDHTA